MLFRSQVNLHNLRCIFYDKQINGCSLHQSGMKPPQCWVYPTGLDPDSVKTMCKKADGWRIINPHVIQVCKKILEQYIISCKDEAARLNTSDILVSKIPDCLLALEKELKPSEMAGILLENENFTVLKGEGFNMGLKSICDSHNCGQNYFECTKICSSINKMLVS